MTSKMWQVIDTVVPAGAREAVEYGLMEAGALGTETIELPTETVRVVGYFESPVELDGVRAKLINALKIYSVEKESLGELTTRELPERDWLAEWKKHWQPVEVGPFVIAPPWSAAPIAG